MSNLASMFLFDLTFLFQTAFFVLSLSGSLNFEWDHPKSRNFLFFWQILLHIFRKLFVTHKECKLTVLSLQKMIHSNGSLAENCQNVWRKSRIFLFSRQNVACERRRERKKKERNERKKDFWKHRGKRI